MNTILSRLRGTQVSSKLFKPPSVAPTTVIDESDVPEQLRQLLAQFPNERVVYIKPELLEEPRNG